MKMGNPSQLIRLLLTCGYVLKHRFFRPLSATSLPCNLKTCLKHGIFESSHLIRLPLTFGYVFQQGIVRPLSANSIAFIP